MTIACIDSHNLYQVAKHLLELYFNLLGLCFNNPNKRNRENPRSHQHMYEHMYVGCRAQCAISNSSRSTVTKNPNRTATLSKELAQQTPEQITATIDVNWTNARLRDTAIRLGFCSRNLEPTFLSVDVDGRPTAAKRMPKRRQVT